jgi:hypothetical protein
MNDMRDDAFKLRKLINLEGLVGRAGWCVDRIVEGNPLYHVVRLEKLATFGIPAQEPAS